MSSNNSLYLKRHTDSLYFAPLQECCELTITFPRHHFLASEIARAIEDCNANLINLNVTSEITAGDAGMVTADLRVTTRNTEAIVRSLERYGYEVTTVESVNDPADNGTLAERADLLIKQIEL